MEINSFLATVNDVFPTNTNFQDRIEGNISIYDNNRNFAKEDASDYGAITFLYQGAIYPYDKAYPFDKNNFTFPIKGETVIILKIDGQSYYLPFSRTPYSNYRRHFATFEATKRTDNSFAGGDSSAKDYRTTVKTGGSSNNTNQTKNDIKYPIKPQIKFLNPKEGDTILSGRVGNTIRFSEFFLTEDGKTSSPGIFIRNRQNNELDSKPIGTLVEEDINKDGTSVYITSNKIKVPFKETIEKAKIGFKEYPNSSNLSGDQLFVNSDRIVLSAKAKEFVIFGKGNSGIITDGNFSIDAKKEIYLHNEKNITIHSAGANQIFINSENGKIYLGKNQGEGDAGADVQKMVLGGELVQLMGDLIDAITQQSYLTPAGTSGVGPLNLSTFNSIKSKLNTLLSAKNYLSKN